MRKTIIILACTTLIAVFVSCDKALTPELRSINIVGYSDAEYAEVSKVLDLPRVFHDYRGSGALANATKATLGRVLFYDDQLSEDRSVSCASCHQQRLAFSDDVDFSKGIYGRLTDRNSIALGSFESFEDEYGAGSSASIAAKPLFWDLRGETVHKQMIETIANDKEMGMSINEILNRLRDQAHYQILFDNAFGIPGVNGNQFTETNMLDALAAFMRGMSTRNTRFDRALGHLRPSVETVSADFLAFAPDENVGKTLFINHCSSCHASSIKLAPNSFFSTREDEMANNGLERVSVDEGAGGVTGVPEEVGQFKIPSLRNIGSTAPYMHDGRFASLSEVVDFYSSNIQPHENLDDRLKGENGEPVKFDLSDSEKSALVAFLHTLSDMSEIGHEKFSDPWK